MEKIKVDERRNDINTPINRYSKMKGERKEIKKEKS
jgi:hypothetical protein